MKFRVLPDGPHLYALENLLLLLPPSDVAIFSDSTGILRKYSTAANQNFWLRMSPASVAMLKMPD